MTKRKLKLVAIYMKLGEMFASSTNDKRKRHFERKRGKIASLIYEA